MLLNIICHIGNMHSQYIPISFLLNGYGIIQVFGILPQIKKKPSTSEIIDWIQALQHGGVDVRRIVKEVPYVGVLLKKNEDIDVLRRQWR